MQIILWSGSLAFSCTNPSHGELRRFLFISAFSNYVLVGAVLWVWEMNYCSFLLPYYLRGGGVTFHVLWHVGSVFGAYLLNLFLTVCRSLDGARSLRSGEGRRRGAVCREPRRASGDGRRAASARDGKS